MRRDIRGVIALVVAACVLGPMNAPADAMSASEYRFTKVADSVEDGFSPFSFECSSINNRGDIAFRTARVPKGGSQLVQGIYRAAAGKRGLKTIAEFGDGFDFLSQIPSINDGGQVAFAVSDFTQSGDEFIETKSIMRSSGGRPTTIATDADGFTQFGFEPTINNYGTVAFNAQLVELDEFNNDQGLFSGRGDRFRPLTTNYRSSMSKFSEFSSLSRPSINNHGAIAFQASVDGEGPGIFRTDRYAPDGFRTIAAPDPNVNPGWPTFNEAGTVAFQRLFNDSANQELVTGTGGPLTVVTDVAGPYASFGQIYGITPPALNANGDVAFFAELDAGGNGIFTGDDPVTDRVIGTGDRLDGETVVEQAGFLPGLRFCDESLNDQGQLVLQVAFEDPRAPDGVRVAIYRATPRP
ncbi:MAG TPA: choice-of-anchor tandem repeat NxxGxxAF-containing protein [Nocardioides sp.]|nr:choice-of-anchor tandem repeat NxxGxxAF-containing protein [Nocardioides sp.]